jgi:antitoxin ParD1/3/4
MDVHLTPDIEKIVRSKLQSGLYSSASEFVGDALLLMKQREEVRQKIAKGLESLQRDKGIDGDEAFRQLNVRHNRYKHKKRG